jgi:hypothetical protein
MLFVVYGCTKRRNRVEDGPVQWKGVGGVGVVWERDTYLCAGSILDLCDEALSCRFGKE